MCETCGCGENDKPKIIDPQHDDVHYYVHEHDGIIHSHAPSHDHNHEHDHGNKGEYHATTEILVEKDILNINELNAARNQGYFDALGILAVNLVSSPGSGKTSLLEKLIGILKNEMPVMVIEGDQQGSLDAYRLQQLEIPVIQINTGKTCHLDAITVGEAIHKLRPPNNALLFIENVGNLMCPSLFNLGEHFRMVLLSTAEGDDKPLKYPYMFHTSQVCIITKTDLLPYTSFDMEKARINTLKVNPSVLYFETSAKTGFGLQEVADWLRKQRNDRLV